MEVISSDVGGDKQELLTLLLHGSVNGRADRLRFGHCGDIQWCVGGGVD
jgi:hypothetical protein